MFPPELAHLLTLAEIAVAVAGFSAIVVLFKRRDSGTWQGADADRFHGMIVHSVAAVLLCLLPAGIGVFTQQPTRLWAIASGVMGLQVLAHSGIVALYLRSSTRTDAVMIGLGGAFVVALQVLNVLGVGFDRSGGPYLVGVLWHLLHAIFLFTLLVWVREGAIER